MRRAEVGHRLEVLRLRRALLALLPGAGRGVLGALVGAHLLGSLAPGGIAVATGWLLTSALDTAGAGGIVAPLALVAVLVLLGQCVEIAREPLDLLAVRRIDGRLRSELRRRVTGPRGIAHLDEVGYADDVARVSEAGGWRTRTPGTGAVGQLTLAGRLLGATLSAFVLAWYAPVLAVGLLGVTLLMRAGIRRQWVRLGGIWDSRSGDRRRMKYWADTLSGPRDAKEIRLFGLGVWMTERHTDHGRAWLTEIWAERRGILRRQWWTFLLALGAGLAALSLPGAALAAGEIGAGELITMVLAAWGVFTAGAMGHEAFDIEYAVGALRAFERLAAHPSAAEGGSGGTLPAPTAPTHICFKGTGFRYPGSDRVVLDGLDLDIRPGEVLGIVGRNGAGKTTMLKLLTGLQSPTAGSITLDGVDLADFDVDSWRRRVSPVFQDFLHYPLTARENIALGAPEVDADDAAILSAADAAGARELIERLPDGLDTLLTREHTGGVDLSGGQWQRIAIARALFAVAHGRHLLVLDEPTAHLDVRAETEFYDRVVAAVSGVRGSTVVLISHRLSTVRRADRIVLLEGGRTTEAGSHSELMDLGGDYADLYQLQASRFVADETEWTVA